MTRIPGAPVDSASVRPAESNTSAPASGTPSGSGFAVLYGTTVFRNSTFGQVNDGRGSLRARQLAKIAARKAALAKRQRRNVSGGDDDADDFGDAGSQSGTLRAERGGGAGGGGGGGSGGHSHQDEHGGGSGNSAPLAVTVPKTPPVPSPKPGAISKHLAAEGKESLQNGSAAQAWFSSVLDVRKKLLANPTCEIDSALQELVLDLRRAQEEYGCAPAKGAEQWREWLKEQVEPMPKRPGQQPAQAAQASASGPHEPDRIGLFNLLLPLFVKLHDQPTAPSRIEHSKNTVTTIRNGILARHGKR
ncbi:hypothetical protein LJR230_004112 [Trinickia sp. LjRoot230]|uniref:hypothetical protein n=1 Tax=Trinickia sp. LjRoot230 TaxID=3342288 RepID=UPI003ECDF14E